MEKEKQTTKKQEEQVAPKPDYYNERVPLLIPRDLSNPKISEKLIIVNGHAYQVKLGVEVMVPRKVYLAYMDAEKQKAREFEFAAGAKGEE